MNMKLSEELSWRGFVNQTTFHDIADLDQESRTFYWGVDPSAASMTIGNLAAAMMVKIFIKHGYKPVLLVGGATGLIGDPDGKAQERELKSNEEITQNKQSIVKQYERIFSGLDFDVVDNYDWFKDLGYLEFLRTVGKHVPMRQMLGREFVQSRLSEGGAGISYAEFSYSLIQGYDFLHLFENYGVTLQLSGADQWGNSIAGVDMIRRKASKEAHVWTAPLIVNKSTGVKFGKSESGAVWLDAKLTSPFQFYQFWLNLDDDGVGDYLKIFTELDKAQIDSILHEFEENRGARAAQKSLAYQVTKLVHGEESAIKQQELARALFETRDFERFSIDDFEQLESELPFAELKDGDSYIEGLVQTKLASSNSEARRLIESKAVTTSKSSSIQIDSVLNKNDTLDGYVVIFKGKKHIGLIKLK